MKLWKRRAATAAVALLVLILLSSLVYHYVMIAFEGRSPTYFNSLRAVVETYTGTGYGADAPWDSPVANVLVTVMDLSTFLLVFIILPYVFRPVLEEALSPDVPTTTDATDHTVVCDYTERTENLIEEFESRGIGYVVIVEEDDRAIDLMEQGVSVVHGDPSSADALGRANVEGATAVVVDTEDSESASVVLAVREVNPGVHVAVLVRDLALEKYLRYAGADAVLTPRRLLGRRIAERIRSEVSPYLTDSTRVSDDSEFALVELMVSEESPVSGETIADSGLLDGLDAEVPALLKGGEFFASPSHRTVLGGRTVLLVSGDEDELAELENRLYPGAEGEAVVVVAGFGEVGSTVAEKLRFGDTDCAVVDTEETEGVDIVGDATEEDVLREAGIEDATAFVSAVQGDDVAILSVLVARELVPDLDVIARVNDSENKNKIRRAGADYVLSLPEISGRILASEVVGEEPVWYDRQFEVLRVEGSRFAGDELEDTPLATEDTVVVAVDRDGGVIADLPHGFVFEKGDEVLVAGTDDAVDSLKASLSEYRSP